MALFAQPLAAAAQDIIIVTTVVTTVEAPFGGTASADLLQGSGSVSGDTASTGQNSLMQLTMSDGSGGLILGSNSSATLGGGGGGLSLSGRGQIHGQFRSGSNVKFEVKQVLIGGIRGTTFTLEARTGWARVRTYDGTVMLQNVEGRARSVTVEKGHETVIRVPAPPTRPKRFTHPANPFWE